MEATGALTVTSEPSTSERRLALLGGFAISVAGRPVTMPITSQRLVALLALRGRCGRSRVAGSLWPDTTEIRALANLRTAIWRAGRVCPGLVCSGSDALALADDVDVDVTRLVQQSHQVLAGATTTGEQPTATYADGDLLPDWQDEWLLDDRERLRQLRLHVLEALADQLADQRRFAWAMEAALAALRADPLRESAHRAVIRVHLAEGNVAEAVRAYRRCVAVLHRDLGAPPTEATSALVSRLVGPAAPDRRRRATPV